MTGMELLEIMFALAAILAIQLASAGLGDLMRRVVDDLRKGD
ncbi:MAG: hypothetical protein WC455_20575 [Dehalococcoidia bacterium]|jgi:hypothetical protein